MHDFALDFLLNKHHDAREPPTMSNGKDTDRAPSPPPYAFWIGLPLMLLFVGAGFGGGTWALDRILLERALYKDGEVIPGILLRKSAHHTKAAFGGTNKTVYTVSYRFEVDAGTVYNEARIEGKRFYPLKNGDSIDIRYLPDNPEKNLPDGSRLSGLFIFFAAFGFVIGSGALVVVIGMIVDRARKRRATNSRV